MTNVIKVEFTTKPGIKINIKQDKNKLNSNNISLKEKVILRSLSRRAVLIKGNMYYVLTKDFQISSWYLEICEAEFNLHQQKTYDHSSNKNVKMRCLLFNKFPDKINGYKSDQEKSFVKFDKEMIKFLNDIIIPQVGTILNLNSILGGNNPSGAEKSKSSSPFVVSDLKSKYYNKPFINLFKAIFIKKKPQQLSKDSFAKIKNKIFLSIDNYESKISLNKKLWLIYNTFLSFYNKSNPLFYYENYYKMINKIDFNINEKEKDNNSINAYRRIFRENLISKYDYLDFFYNKPSSASMLEAAHIKSVKDIKLEFLNKDNNQMQKEIQDVNNGLLLNPTVHKLFDELIISFDEKDGKLLLNPGENDLVAIKNILQINTKNFEGISKLLKQNSMIKYYLAIHNKKFNRNKEFKKLIS